MTAKEILRKEYKGSKNFIAWLNGVSVACGTLRDVEARAREIFSSVLWQTHEGSKGQTVLRITRGSRQSFVKSILLAEKPRLADGS